MDLLTLTLEEEKETDLKLTQATEQDIMPAAMGDGTKDEETPKNRKGMDVAEPRPVT